MSHQTQSINRARDLAQRQPRNVGSFDYDAPAELYPSRIKKGRGAYLEVDEARFDVAEMRYLYEATAYPLKRKPVAA